VKRFIDKILENSILLKEITANFVNKKPYLEKMIAIVDKNFDFQLHERNLLYLLKNFEIKKDKYKNFMSWAKKYPIPVNVNTFKENLKSFDLIYDTISAKESMESK